MSLLFQRKMVLFGLNANIIFNQTKIITFLIVKQIWQHISAIKRMMKMIKKNKEEDKYTYPEIIKKYFPNASDDNLEGELIVIRVVR